MDNIENWTYQDFLTYLLIMGAKADLTISEEEQDEIVRRVGMDEYKKIKRTFEHQNDAQHIETVSILYERYKDDIGGKENLVEALKDVINADNRGEQVMDHMLMSMLKKIL